MGKEKASYAPALLPKTYEILREVVKDYPSFLSSTDQLLIELSARQIGRETVLEELRNYALRNFYHHDHHERGPEAVKVIIGIFLDSITSPHERVRATAVDSLLFYLDKVLADGGQDLQKYSTVLSECFSRLSRLPDDHFLLLTTNSHQVKKLGKHIL